MSCLVTPKRRSARRYVARATAQKNPPGPGGGPPAAHMAAPQGGARGRGGQPALPRVPHGFFAAPESDGRLYSEVVEAARAAAEDAGAAVADAVVSSKVLDLALEVSAPVFAVPMDVADPESSVLVFNPETPSSAACRRTGPGRERPEGDGPCAGGRRAVATEPPPSRADPPWSSGSTSTRAGRPPRGRGGSGRGTPRRRRPGRPEVEKDAAPTGTGPLATRARKCPHPQIPNRPAEADARAARHARVAAGGDPAADDPAAGRRSVRGRRPLRGADVALHVRPMAAADGHTQVLLALTHADWRSFWRAQQGNHNGAIAGGRPGNPMDPADPTGPDPGTKGPRRALRARCLTCPALRALGRASTTWPAPTGASRACSSSTAFRRSTCTFRDAVPKPAALGRPSNAAAGGRRGAELRRPGRGRRGTHLARGRGFRDSAGGGREAGRISRLAAPPPAPRPAAALGHPRRGVRPRRRRQRGARLGRRGRRPAAVSPPGGACGGAAERARERSRALGTPRPDGPARAAGRGRRKFEIRGARIGNSGAPLAGAVRLGARRRRGGLRAGPPRPRDAGARRARRLGRRRDGPRGLPRSPPHRAAGTRRLGAAVRGVGGGGGGGVPKGRRRGRGGARPERPEGPSEGPARRPSRVLGARRRRELGPSWAVPRVSLRLCHVAVDWNADAWLTLKRFLWPHRELFARGARAPDGPQIPVPQGADAPNVPQSLASPRADASPDVVPGAGRVGQP